jgi:hypothetical protein
MKKFKSKRKNLAAIVVVAAVALVIAYFISTIPEAQPETVSASKIGCSDEVHCPDGETCRREISATTDEYFGPYKCLWEVPTGSICEIWQHCESKTCSTGRCVE